MGSVFKHMSSEFNLRAVFLKVNIDKSNNEGLKEKYNIVESPTFHFFVDGKSNQEMVNAGENQLKEGIHDIITRSHM
jgi:hypothetical protein